MNEQDKEKLIQVYNKIKNNFIEIVDVFADYYKEERVDYTFPFTLDGFLDYICIESVYQYCDKNIDTPLLQLEESIKNDILDRLHLTFNPRFTYAEIVVWWPKVRVANENNKYIDISNLYSKIFLCLNGTLIGRPTFNRSEYTILQFACGYMHSHIPRIDYNNLEKFRDSCTGSGPINSTILSLAKERDLDLYRLFCVELDKYVHTESLSGGPYIRLESIGYSNPININYYTRPLSEIETELIDKEQWEDFFKFLFTENVLKFVYIENHYFIGMSFNEFILAVSNTFIKWYNKCYNDDKIKYSFTDLLINDIISKFNIVNGQLKGYSFYWNASRKKSKNVTVLKFKGEDIKLKVTVEDDLDNYLVVLNPHIAVTLLDKILNLINYQYGKKTNLHCVKVKR